MYCQFNQQIFDYVFIYKCLFEVTEVTLLLAVIESNRMGLIK